MDARNEEQIDAHVDASEEHNSVTSHSLSADLENPNLFLENEAGDYTYYDLPSGEKCASGSLVIADEPNRDSDAQRRAGGDARRGNNHEWGHDDGGHLIGARFGGMSGDDNLTAQDSNLNRGPFKHAENEWANHLNAGDKVYVHIETSGDRDRPDAYVGYAIYEHPDGSRDWDSFHYVNESQRQISQWEGDLEQWEAENPEESAELYSQYSGSEKSGLSEGQESFDYTDSASLQQEGLSGEESVSRGGQFDYTDTEALESNELESTALEESLSGSIDYGMEE